MIGYYLGIIVFLCMFVSVSNADILEDLKARQAKIRTVSAEFTQEKKTRLLTKPIRTEGMFLYRQPDKIRWEYKGGLNMQVFFNGKDIWIFYPGLKEADKLSGIDQYDSMIHFDLNNMSRDYIVSAKRNRGAIFISMLPRVKGFTTRIEMEFPDDMPFPNTVKIFDRNNDPTIINFNNIKINSDIPENSFVFVPGKSVTVREKSLR